MSKISAICGKSKIFTIEGIEIEFNSGYLTIDDLPALMSLSDIEKATPEQKTEIAKTTANLLFKVMKRAIPDATDTELKEFSLRNMKEIMPAIMEISGLNKNASN